MSQVLGWLGTRDSVSRTFVDGTCGDALCFNMDGGGSANSVEDILVVSTELLHVL